MAEKLDNGIIYYRSKSDAIGALIVAGLLLGIAAVVLTQDSVFGIGFSPSIVMLCTYWALPIGVILVLVNIKHATAVGPTVVAGKEGITLLYMPTKVGPLRWAEIAGFTSFRHQGKWFLGITFANPLQSLTPIKDDAKTLLKRIGPKAAHLSIPGAMMNDYMVSIETDLEEMRHVYSWRV